MRTRLILGGAAVALAMAGLVLIRNGSATAEGILLYSDAEVVAHGRALYEANCASCHGAALQGEPDWRARDADGYLPAPPHDATGHTWHHPDEQLVAITALGTEKIVGGGYLSRMPGFAQSLDEDDILAVLAFIKSTWPDEVIARHNQINTQNGS